MNKLFDVVKNGLLSKIQCWSIKYNTCIRPTKKIYNTCKYYLIYFLTTKII